MCVCKEIKQRQRKRVCNCLRQRACGFELHRYDLLVFLQFASPVSVAPDHREAGLGCSECQTGLLTDSGENKLQPQTSYASTTEYHPTVCLWCPWGSWCVWHLCCRAPVRLCMSIRIWQSSSQGCGPRYAERYTSEEPEYSYSTLFLLTYSNNNCQCVN